MRAPKDPLDNAAYRRAIIARASKDVAFQEEVWIKCKRDIIFWFDTFLFTYDPKNHPNNPDRPFVTWDFQEDTVLKLQKSIGNYSILCEKSREMGLSWLVLGVFLWFFIFKSGLSFLVGSRKEEYVDKKGDSKTLFWKIDYMMEKLPRWMQPDYERSVLRYTNNNNGSMISGESTNDNFARGDRRTAILLDEFPAVENGFQILDSAGDATNCCIFVGTSKGASGAYYSVREKMYAAGGDRVIRLHWQKHPNKRKGLYKSDKKSASSAWELDILDKGYKFPPDYKFILDGKLRSVAYDEREKIAPNPQTMAQEWDIDYLASGWQFFDQTVIDAQLANAFEPLTIGELQFPSGWERPTFVENEGARLKLWFHPDLDGLVSPDWRDCVAGVDIGAGTGGSMTSNSVVSVWRASTGDKVAEFATQNLMPPDFANYALAICKWFNNAYLIWEGNGTGGVQFTKVVLDSDYSNVFHSENELSISRKKSKNIGWWSDAKSKAALLGGYGTALKTRSANNFSILALKECQEYINDGADKVVHVKSKNSPDPASQGENHGDRVIADALAVRGFEDIASGKEPMGESAPPPHSFGGRQKKRLQEDFKRKRRPLGEWSGNLS